MRRLPARETDNRCPVVVFQSEVEMIVSDVFEALRACRIVPVVKPRQWLTELNNRLKTQVAQQEHLFDDFADELVVVFPKKLDSLSRRVLAVALIPPPPPALLENVHR